MTRRSRNASAVPAYAALPNVSLVHLVQTAEYNVQLIAVEQRSRQSCLNVLHGLGLKLVLGLELFRRLTEIVSTALH